MTELADELDLSKGTVHDSPSTLRGYNYVVKGEGHYIGLWSFELGEYARDRLHIYHVAKPAVQTLANETGELANPIYEEHGLGARLPRTTGRAEQEGR